MEKWNKNNNNNNGPRKKLWLNDFNPFFFFRRGIMVGVVISYWMMDFFFSPSPSLSLSLWLLLFKKKHRKQTDKKCDYNLNNCFFFIVDQMEKKSLLQQNRKYIPIGIHSCQSFVDEEEKKSFIVIVWKTEIIIFFLNNFQQQQRYIYDWGWWWFWWWFWQWFWWMKWKKNLGQQQRILFFFHL